MQGYCSKTCTIPLDHQNNEYDQEKGGKWTKFQILLSAEKMLHKGQDSAGALALTLASNEF